MLNGVAFCLVEPFTLNGFEFLGRTVYTKRGKATGLSSWAEPFTLNGFEFCQAISWTPFKLNGYGPLLGHRASACEPVYVKRGCNILMKCSPTRQA